MTYIRVNMSSSIDVVIVTYNRLDKLRKTLSCYDNQTALFRNLIVVDNNSTDGTSEFLSEWENIHAEYGKHVLSMSENLGGAGGFYQGQKHALSLNPDWILLADDDAYPSETLMEKFYNFLRVYQLDSDEISAICTSVVFPDGSFCYSHRRKMVGNGKMYRLDFSTYDDYRKESFDIDCFSYVGAIIKTRALKMAGLVNPNYFIYYDDSEHCVRLRKYGRILCFPSMQIVHDSGWDTGKSNMAELISWRDYYATRNRLHMLKHHYILSALKFTITKTIQTIQNRKYNFECRRVIYAAIFDAWFNRLGRHRKYKPGWNISK